MQHLPLVDTPFSFICADFLGPLERTATGNAYILVFLDLASRWISAYAVEEATAEIVQHSLLDWIAAHGVPHHVHTDNGSQFIADGVRIAYKRLGIEASLISPYRPQADPAETAVKAVIRTLRALLMSEPETTPDWDTRLPIALFALRASPSDSTGISPFRYLYGRDMRLPLDLILGRPPQQEPVTALQDLPERLQALRERALEYNAHIREQSKRYYDRSHYHRTYNKDDEVLVYNLPVGGKFEPRWLGPFVVHKVYDNRVSYLVGDPYNIQNRLVHVSRLAPYYR
jgi:transposase InsO family protein